MAADVGNSNAHVKDSIAWWIHSTVPTLDRVAPIGDQARVSEPVIYDYHRHLILEARKVTTDATAQANASWWLHNISDQDMESGFNARHNLLPAGPAGTPPSQLVYHATGTGQLFARTGWDTGAMWLAFSAGPYVQSHAHQDQGAFTLFQDDWLAATENIWTHSGIQQGTDTNNVVRFDHNGATVPQHEGTTSTMTVTPGAGGSVHAVANLTPAYDGSPSVTSWQRTIDFADRKLTVSDTFALGAGTTMCQSARAELGCAETVCPFTSSCTGGSPGVHGATASKRIAFTRRHGSVASVTTFASSSFSVAVVR
jgi:hypothetical protein